MRLMILALLVLFALGANTPGEMYSEPALCGITETLVTEVEIGELARLEVTGDRVAWECVPAINDGQAFGENSQRFVCSFRACGLYTVIAAVYIDDNVTIQKFPIQVGIVAPEPTPEPVTPEPATPTPAVNQTLVDTTVQWCKDTTADKPQCLLLAKVFEKVASEIENDTLGSAEAIIARTAELNSEINIDKLVGLMNLIQKYITEESDAQRLIDTIDHAIVWKSIAKGLTQYEANP